MLDSWLLSRFPGRTLEELDNMDWFRYLRAVHAGNIEHAETTLREFREGEKTQKNIDENTWRTIQENNELINAISE